jgi:hypothetical protein
MKRITLRLAIAILTFLIGVAIATLWTVRHYRSSNILVRNEADCIPTYSPISYSANEKGWSAVLVKFQEMPFEVLPACVDESYRLIWIPTFHSPVSVRIWSSRGKRFMVTKRLDGKGGYGMRHLAFEEMRPLSEDEWYWFIRLLSQAGYWDMPSIDDSPLPNDGDGWVIEGIQNRIHHQVNRHSPSAEFRAACVYLVKLSGLKTEIERY